MKTNRNKVRISDMITLNENGTLKYVSSGLFQSDGSWIHPRVTIETYEIIFMYEGTAYICEDGTEYILHPDDVLILDPDREHYGFRVSEEYVSFSWLHFKTSCDRYKNLPKHFHSSNPAMPKTLFSQCMHIANTPGYDPVCTDLYTALYIEEIICNGSAVSISKNHLAAQVKEYVNLNIEKDLTVRLVSEHFGYHENYISKVFKAAYGVLLSRYIVNQRLAYARALLNTTLYTVNQISRQLSFKSENHFVISHAHYAVGIQEFVHEHPYKQGVARRAAETPASVWGAFYGRNTAGALSCH